MSHDNLSDEDKELFRKATQGVTPLKHKNHLPTYEKAVRNTSLPSPIKKMPLIIPTRIQQPNTSTFINHYDATILTADSILSFSRTPLAKQHMRDLKMGKIAIESRLDLHGKNSNDAEKALDKFIQHAQVAGIRSLLIIHGKGGKNKEAPILKTLVNNYLRYLPCVLAFHSAQPKDGGSGALYVLLKKLRAC